MSPANNNIIKQISKAGLVGRGGASYPVDKKWTAVKDALKTKKIGYVIINGAEGEPGVKKDAYIINHYPEEVINGAYLADKFLGKDKIRKIYIFFNSGYYKKYSSGIKEVLALKKYAVLAKKIEFFIKPQELTYISGEETALLNLISGLKVEPRLKPPFPTSHGLFGHPTLIDNTETFYNISLVSKGKYRQQRFYTITGVAKRPGVYELPAIMSIEEVLRQTGNYPDKKFFVQVGGEASGEVLNSEQLMGAVEGSGSIMVYDYAKTDKDKLFQRWLNFYQAESCGLCTACREGTYRLVELTKTKNFDQALFETLLDNLELASFCGLGYSAPIPLKTYIRNIL